MGFWTDVHHWQRDEEHQENHEEIIDILVELDVVPVAEDDDPNNVKFMRGGEDLTEEVDRRLRGLMDYIDVHQIGNPADVSIWSSDCGQDGTAIRFQAGGWGFWNGEFHHHSPFVEVEVVTVQKKRVRFHELKQVKDWRTADGIHAATNHDTIIYVLSNPSTGEGLDDEQIAALAPRHANSIYYPEIT